MKRHVNLSHASDRFRMPAATLDYRPLICPILDYVIARVSLAESSRYFTRVNTIWASIDKVPAQKWGILGIVPLEAAMLVKPPKGTS
jgi:hypothetical protein